MKTTFFFLVTLLFAPLLVGQVVQYDQMRVARVDLIPENLDEGATFDAVAVKRQMQTKVGNYFSQTEFDQDLKSLAAEYDRIEPTFQVVSGELYITIRIHFKPVIRSIVFCGNEHFSARKLNKQLKIKPGELFEREAFIAAFNKLKFFYVKKGYFESSLSFAVVPVEGTGAVDIVVTVDEGRAGRIGKIVFCGLGEDEEDELIEVMMTRPYNFVLSWYNGRGCYHPDMIEHDRIMILNYLQNQGYADATVEMYTEEVPGSDRITLVICVDRGVCYTVGCLALEGNTLFSNQQIWDRFTFGMGGPYSPEAVRGTASAIQDLYGACGYIDTIVDFQVTLREDCPIYDIVVSVEESEQVHVGMIRVFGNTCTRTRVILNESLLFPGEVFDIRRLEGTERRLLNTGYFANVNVYPVKAQCEEPGYRDIFVEVEETDTGNVGVFFGLSSIDNLFGGLELSERNFNVMGIGSLLSRGPSALRGNGEYLHLKANIGDRQTSYLGQWTKPYFFDTPWALGVDVEKTNNRALSRGYEIKTYGGNVHATYVWNDFMKYDVFYRARQTNVNIIDSSNAQLEQEGNRTGFISAVGATAIYDSTDHPRRPRHGLRSRFLFEVAGAGGNYQFFKLAYLNTLYYPITRKGTFKFRADLQFISTYGSTEPKDLPLAERLYLGGENTVRGYRPFIIGPKFGNNEPRGGVSSYLLSEEYSHNLLDVPCLDAFVFVDAGYVSLSEFTIGRQAASVGFGIRAEVMRNMPMTLGLGWPIHPTEKRNGQTLNNARRFFFSMGGIF